MLFLLLFVRQSQVLLDTSIQFLLSKVRHEFVSRLAAIDYRIVAGCISAFFLATLDLVNGLHKVIFLWISYTTQI